MTKLSSPGIPVFKDGELEMIISYSSWEITGFDDLREAVTMFCSIRTKSFLMK